MDVRNTAGLFLIIVGSSLIVARARKKGDLALTGGLWPVIGQLGDALYIIGTIMIIAGVLMIAPDLGDVLFPESSTTTTTTTTPTTTTG